MQQKKLQKKQVIKKNGFIPNYIRGLTNKLFHTKLFKSYILIREIFKMFFRLQLLTLNIATAILLIFFLCLGSQNLGKKHRLDFLINKTVALPIGFIIGTSFTLGLISGGLTSVLMINNNAEKN